MITQNKILSSKVIVSLILVMTLIMSTGLMFNTSAKSIADLEKEYSSIQKEMKNSEKRLTEIQTEIASQDKVIAEIKEQIAKAQEQIEILDEKVSLINVDIEKYNESIAVLQSEIDAINADISRAEAEIDARETEIENKIDAFNQRVRATYMAGDASLLELLLSSKSISSFLTRAEMVKRVTESDQELVDNLNKEVEMIAQLKEDLSDSKKTVEQKKKVLNDEKQILVDSQNELQASIDTLADKQNELSQKNADVNSKIAALDKSSESYKKEVSAYESAMEKVEAEINKVMQETGASSTISFDKSSGWLWPVPYSNSYVSSPYGYRSDPISGSRKLHEGIDITMPGAMGKKLVATKSGVVVSAVWSNSGYGNYVIIDHGNGYKSLYGHCSSLVVTVGQKVAQGQHIANIGSTGYSTGPHVHFEIRINNQKVNPASYVKK